MLKIKKNKKVKNSFCCVRKYNFSRILLISLLLGIFLLPNIAYFSSITNERIIELTNKVRKEYSLPGLNANQLLQKAAYDKAYAILNSQIFAHKIGNKKFSSWVKDAGYPYLYTGENLAIDFVTSEGAMKAWLKSPSHKKNIINRNFTEIGVAVVDGKFHDKNSIIIVQIFGKKAQILPVGKISTTPQQQSATNQTTNQNSYLNSSILGENSNFLVPEILTTNSRQSLDKNQATTADIPQFNPAKIKFAFFGITIDKDIFLSTFLAIIAILNQNFIFYLFLEIISVLSASVLLLLILKKFISDRKILIK